MFHGLVHINPLWLVFKDILLCSIFLLYIYKKKKRKKTYEEKFISITKKEVHAF